MQTVAVSALNTTCEGIWILQGRCGIETLPATLCLRPWLSESGTPPIHPALSESGAVSGETVHPTIQRWLEVLAAPDIELCVLASRGAQHLRMVVARRDGLHVAASRCGNDVTVEEIGGVRRCVTSCRGYCRYSAPTLRRRGSTRCWFAPLICWTGWPATAAQKCGAVWVSRQISAGWRPWRWSSRRWRRRSQSLFMTAVVTMSG